MNTSQEEFSEQPKSDTTQTKTTQRQITTHQRLILIKRPRFDTHTNSKTFHETQSNIPNTYAQEKVPKRCQPHTITTKDHTKPHTHKIRDTQDRPQHKQNKKPTGS